jgi:hypothetical protein
MASRLRPPRILAVLVSAFALAASMPALAEPSLADRETARSLMEDGDQKRDKGDLKGALKSFEAADAIMKVPTTGLEVAKVQAALGLLLEARETLQRVMRIPPKPGEPAPFPVARKNAEQLSNELGTRLPSVQVTIVNAEAGSTPTVMIDNDTIPAAAAGVPRKVNPGPHVVLVKAGSAEKREEFSVNERDIKIVNVDLKPAPAPGPTPETSGGKTGTGKILMFGGFGLAIVGVGVGTVTGLMSISKTNELKEECPNNLCPAGRQGDVDSAQSLGNLSTVAFIVGGVGIAVGVVGLIMTGRESKEAPAAQTKPQIRPLVGGTYVGLGGSF